MTSSFNITPSPTNAEILASLLGDTTGLSNIQITVTGNPLAIGLFQDSPLSLSGGVVLSTGKVSDLVGANTTDANNISTDFNGAGTVTGGRDAVTLDITFDVDNVDRILYFLYAFGSEVFLDGIGGSSKDTFTLELNGQNLAFLTDGITNVSIDTLAPPAALIDSSLFSSDYINNLSDTDPGFSSTTLDGYTTPLRFKGNLNPGSQNRLKITIQDIGNGTIDSALFLKAETLGVNYLFTTVSLSVSPDRVNEDGVDYLVYTFTRNHSNGSLQINYLVDGTADPANDYTLDDGTIIDLAATQNARFESGSTTTTVKIALKPDSSIEGDETISLKLISTLEPTYRVLTPEALVGTILDQDTAVNTVSISVIPASVAENDLPSGNLIYTFTRTGPVDEILRVDFSVDGTAEFISDYTAIGANTFHTGAGTVTFAAGSNKATVMIDPKIDSTAEPDETVILTLQPSGYDTLAIGSGGRIYNIDPGTRASTGTITDPPTITVKLLGPAAVNEDGTTSLAYEFTRTGTFTSTLSVSYAIGGAAILGEATIGDDYGLDSSSITSSIGTIVFDVGSETAIVFIDPKPDVLEEANETVSLKLLPAVANEYVVGTTATVVGTILDQDTVLNNISLAVSPSSVIEDDSTANLVYTFTRTGPTNESLRVDYTVGGSASLPVDYDVIGATNFQSTQGSVVFAEGAKTAEVIIDPRADLTQEKFGETVELTLVEGRDDTLAGGRSRKYGIDTPGAITGTIEERLSVINVALTTPSVNEDGTENLVYTFTRTTTFYQLYAPLTVYYSYSGTATLGDDYSVAPPATLGSITFSPGSPTATLTIDPTPDSIEELGGETFELTLQLPPTNSSALYIVGTTGKVTGTIVEPVSAIVPVVTVSLNPSSVREDGATNLVYTFTRTGATSQELIVSYDYSSTAELNIDYNIISGNPLGTIVFAPGASTAILTVDPIPDSILETAKDDETFSLTLIKPTGSNVAYTTVGIPTPIVGTIIDATPSINLSVAPAEVKENGGIGLVYTFTRSVVTNQPLIVNFSISGSATFASGDYSQAGATTFVGTSGTVTFAADAATATVTLTPKTDVLIEADETIALQLAPATGTQYYAIGTQTAVTGTILELNRISLSVTPSSVTEDGTTNLVYTFVRTGPIDKALRVDYSIASAATFGADYDQIGANTFGSKFGTVNFAVGSDKATVTIDPKADNVFEQNETIEITLAPSGSDTLAGLPNDRGYIIDTIDTIKGTITDATPTVTVALEPTTVNEDGTASLIYTFTRTGSTSTALTASYKVGGIATFTSNDITTDYTQTGATNFTSTAGNIVFAANANTAKITVTPKADTNLELNETVVLTLDDGISKAIPYQINALNTATGIIIEPNSAPIPEINLQLIKPVIIDEGGQPTLNYLFTRTGLTTQPLTVGYKVSGTATFTSDDTTTDYTQTGAMSFGATIGSIEFAAGNSEANLLIKASADSVIEPNESVAIDLTSSSDYILGSQKNAVGGIQDTTPRIDLSLSPTEVKENGGIGLVYTFTRSVVTNQPLTVKFSIAGGATFDSDYSQAGATTFAGTSGTVTFAANSATATVTLTPTADVSPEKDETVTLQLAPATGNQYYAIGTQTAVTGTILELNRTSLAVAPVSVIEDGTTNLIYTFTRTGPIDKELRVDYSVAGTAELGSDYDQIGANTFGSKFGTVKFAAGSDKSTVTIDPKADNVFEQAETIELTLAPSGSDTLAGFPNDRGYIIDTIDTIKGTITDATPTVTVALEPMTVNEDGATSLVYTFTRTGSTSTALIASYKVSGTAIFTSDYTQTGTTDFTDTKGTITFAANANTAKITITPKADTNGESNETVILTLDDGISKAVPYQINTLNTATGTIIEPIPVVTIDLKPVTISEGGQQTLNYLFTRSNVTNQTLTVKYNVGGNAQFGIDYDQTGAASFGATTGSITFAAGAAEANLVINAISDSEIEINEEVLIDLVGDSNYTVGLKKNAVGTIVDTTPRIDLSLSPIEVKENGGIGLFYTFTRSIVTNQPLTVNFNIAGSATSDSNDYSQTGAKTFDGKSGTVTFAANSATATVTITPTADLSTEKDETVTLQLAPATGNQYYAIGTQTAVTGTILELNRIILAVAPASVIEDGATNLVYTFTRTGPIDKALRVDYSVAGTADLGSDYDQIGANTFRPNIGTAKNFSTVNFAAGSDKATVTIDPKADNIFEQAETIEITLAPSGSDTLAGLPNDRGYIIDTIDTIKGTITDATPTVTITLEPATVNEDGTASLVYTFTRSIVTDNLLTVNFSIAGDAILDDDYSQAGATFTGKSGTVTFAAKASTATVTVTPKVDSFLEATETVDLKLSAASIGQYYAIGTPATITGSIIDSPIVVQNLPPTAIVFNDNASNNSFSIAENTSTANRIKIANIKIIDDRLGTNLLSLSGTDASSFELDGADLYLKSGIVLDYETRTNYKLAVNVDDATVGKTPDVFNSFTIVVTDVNESPTGAPIFIFSDILQNTSRLISATALLAGFSDVERDVLSVTGLRATNGTITKNNNGTFNFIPNNDFVGKIDLIYDVTDGVSILPNQTLGFKMLPLSEALNFTGTSNLDVASINNLATGTFAVNPRNINLTGDEINLLGGQDSVIIPGKEILLQSFSPSQNIQLGDSDSGSSSILDLTATDLAAIANGFSKITFGRANGTGNININSDISFRDPVLLQSPGGQVNITAAITLIDDATLDFDTQTLVKAGASTLALIGNKPTTSIGRVIINGGNLALAKAINIDALNNSSIVINSGGLQLGNSDQINDAADLTLNGGIVNMNGFNETIDLLKVTSNSTIDFGNSSSDLAFGDSSTQDWTGLLTIENWSNTSGETLRFGNSNNALTAAQLNNIQFTGFGRGAKIDSVGFVTPIEITRTIPTSIADEDGISEAIENLAPNNGDGNRDGVLDSQQDNVTSILTLGGTTTNNVATLVSRPGTKINNLRLLPSPIVAADLTSIANPAEFKITGVGLGQATTVEFLLAKADQNRKYNTYLMSGKTAANPTTHLYEFLFDGQTGAELFDTNSDGFTDKVVVHFIDGQRGDNDLTVNSEIQDPGAPGISDNTISLNKDINNVIQVAGNSGAAVVDFSLVTNQSKQVNEVGFFKIDANNKVNGIAANANGFAQAALQSGEVVFSALGDNLLNTTDISRQLQLSAGDRLGFYLVQNGTVDAALRKNDFSNVVFSTDQANPNSKNYLQVNPLTGSGYQLKWTGAANDLTLNLQLQDAPLNNQNLIASAQGDRESELLDLRSLTGQNVQVNFTLKREAAYNNTVGFYKVEDAQGTVISLTGATLKPGEAGYSAAVIQNRIAGIDLAATNGQTISIEKTLTGGAIYAPFLISNADANSLNGNFSNVFTPYLVGNSDGVDHLRLLGDNTFGFEDVVGGGDQDFNDVILKAVFKTI
jgi:Cadherin-like domain/Domain of unknown function (DUF4114)/Calx-beta domain